MQHFMATICLQNFSWITEIPTWSSVWILYLILPPCDVSKPSGAQPLLQLPGAAGQRLLQGASIHGLRRLTC